LFLKEWLASDYKTNKGASVGIFIAVVAIIVGFVIARTISNRGIEQVSAQAAQELIKDSAVTILDVRSPGEYQKGHLKRARLLPVNEIGSRISELQPLKDKPILVYCHSGTRSSAANQILRKNGFTKTRNLQGGVAAWTRAGYKLSK
jgi:rhodanese-related sulfurtransferase